MRSGKCWSWVQGGRAHSVHSLVTTPFPLIPHHPLTDWLNFLHVPLPLSRILLFCINIQYLTLLATPGLHLTGSGDTKTLNSLSKAECWVECISRHEGAGITPRCSRCWWVFARSQYLLSFFHFFKATPVCAPRHDLQPCLILSHTNHSDLVGDLKMSGVLNGGCNKKAKIYMHLAKCIIFIDIQLFQISNRVQMAWAGQDDVL